MGFWGGWNESALFSPAAYLSIYGHSAGIPRRINTLCDRLLLAAFLAERPSIGEDEVREVIAEIDEEFSAARTAPSLHSAEPVTDQMPALEDAALARLRLGPALAGQLADLTAQLDLQRIEGRLAGIEQSVAATLGILNQLLQALRRKAALGEPAE